MSRATHLDECQWMWARVPDIGDLNSVTRADQVTRVSQSAAGMMCDARSVIMPCTLLTALTLKT